MLNQKYKRRLFDDNSASAENIATTRSKDNSDSSINSVITIFKPEQSPQNGLVFFSQIPKEINLEIFKLLGRENFIFSYSSKHARNWILSQPELRNNTISSCPNFSPKEYINTKFKVNNLNTNDINSENYYNKVQSKATALLRGELDSLAFLTALNCDHLLNSYRSRLPTIITKCLPEQAGSSSFISNAIVIAIINNYSAIFNLLMDTIKEVSLNLKGNKIFQTIIANTFDKLFADTTEDAPTLSKEQTENLQFLLGYFHANDNIYISSKTEYSINLCSPNAFSLDLRPRSLHVFTELTASKLAEKLNITVTFADNINNTMSFS